MQQLRGSGFEEQLAAAWPQPLGLVEGALVAWSQGVAHLRLPLLGSSFEAWVVLAFANRQRCQPWSLRWGFQRKNAS